MELIQWNVKTEDLDEPNKEFIEELNRIIGSYQEDDDICSIGNFKTDREILFRHFTV